MFVNPVVAWLYTIIGAACAVVEVWALVDAAIRPAGAFTAAGKASKTLWLVLTGASVCVGVFGILPFGSPGLGGIASLAAIVVCLVYLVDVRPAVRGGRRPPNRPSGPAGGW